MKFKYIVLGACLALSTASCEKWLDVTASNQIKSDELFETAGGFRDALLGVYINMTDVTSYGRDMTWNAVDLLSQQYAALPNTGIYYDIQTFNYTTVRAENAIAPMWMNQYKTIVNINNILSHIEADTEVIGSTERSIIKGELLALRAFLHFDLIRLFGHGNYANRPELATKPTVPYVLGFSKETTSQLDYQQTYGLLEKDILEALELLKEDPVYPNTQRPENYYTEINRNGFYNDRNFRMNYYAAKALQSRVLSWQGKKEAAALAAEEVIQSSFVRLFDGETPGASNRTLIEENLFALDVEQLNTVLEPYLQLNNAANPNVLFMPQALATTVFETANPNIGIADIRYNTLLTNHSRGRVSVKYTGTMPPDGRVNTRLPLIKLPEMYYIAAEYYAETNSGKAIGYLNEVRSSRNIQEALPAMMSPTEIKAELTKEYRKEYIAEGQLFFYYKRLGFEAIPNAGAMTDRTYLLPYPKLETEYGNRVQF